MIALLKSVILVMYPDADLYHARGDGDPRPPGSILTFALAGNQNCGKTTLFNQLTGANQHVGNFPGVTVDRKSGCPVSGSISIFAASSNLSVSS